MGISTLELGSALTASLMSFLMSRKSNVFRAQKSITTTTIRPKSVKLAQKTLFITYRQNYAKHAPRTISPTTSLTNASNASLIIILMLSQECASHAISEKAYFTMKLPSSASIALLESPFQKSRTNASNARQRIPTLTQRMGDA